MIRSRSLHRKVSNVQNCIELVSCSGGDGQTPVEVNKCRLAAFLAFVWCILWVQSLDALGNLAFILGPKLGLEKDEQEDYFALLISLSVVCLMLGSICAGMLQQQRRRTVLMCTITFSCSGILLASFVINKPLFMLGYLMKELGTGCSYVIAAKFVEEIVPDNLLGVYYTMMPLALNSGFVVCSYMTNLLPSPDAPQQILIDNKTY